MEATMKAEKLADLTKRDFDLDHAHVVPVQRSNQSTLFLYFEMRKADDLTNNSISFKGEMTISAQHNKK